MNSRKRDLVKNIDKPLVAGVLMLIVFAIALTAGVSIFYLGEDIAGGVEELTRDPDGPVGVCGIFMLIFGAGLLIGGICAIKKVYWGIALLASILGIFTIGPYYLGSILSIAALLLLMLSRDEFTRKGRSFSFSPGTAKNRWHR